MRLVIPFADGWVVEESERAWVRAEAPGRVILVSPVRPLPAVAGSDFFAAEVGAGFQIEEPVETRGSRGWPVTLVGGSGGGERRRAAIYRLLDRFATALSIGEGDDAIILAGDLDWSGPPASLAAILGVD